MPKIETVNNNFTFLKEILYGGLEPWLDQNKPDEKFVSKLTEIKKVEPIFPPQYEIDFFRPFNHKTKYYHKLILNKSISYCNKIYGLVQDEDNQNVLKYWEDSTLNKKFPSMMTGLGELLKSKQYSIDYVNPRKTAYNIDADHKTETYIMQLLKISLCKTYLEVQSFFTSIEPEDLFIEEDLYTRFLFEPVPEKSYIIKAPQVIPVQIKTRVQKKLSFDCKLNNTNKLKDICKLLNLKIDFLNEDLTSEDDFIQVLTSKNLSEITTQIHINCETTQFRYIIDKLKPYFNSLLLSNIEKSKLFFSKNQVMLTATNLSRNKHEAPKEKESIDNIIKQLQ